MKQEAHRSICCPRIGRGLVLGLGALALAATLSACEGGIGDALGLGKNAPDEFAVVRSAPLTLPPDFTLRPPRPGEARPNEESVREQAKVALFNEAGALAIDDSSAAATTQGEAAFIERAGAADVDPNIRHIVDREFSGYASEDESFIDSLLFWQEEQLSRGLRGEAAPSRSGSRKSNCGRSGRCEAERLRENAEAGKPVTAGETPTIKRREKALLEGVF